MRIEPEQQIAARTRQPESSPSGNTGFASTLATVRDASTTAPPAVDPSRPAAEQWGQWGQGASAAGYGPAPDAAQFAHHPTGPDAGAHPLNPRGNTVANPAFTVPGYTTRGTPVPPGFYNLAYYNQYLAEGGTPLVGFEAHDPTKGTLTDVYGTFGDGRERATSFVNGLVDSRQPALQPAATILALETRSDPTRATGAVEQVAASVTTREAAAPVPASATDPALATVASTATAPDNTPDTVDTGTLVADTAHHAARLALQTLLDDLLSIA